MEPAVSDSGLSDQDVVFVKKGYGKEYITGLAKGFALCRRDKKVQFCWKHLRSYLKIQWELWVNVIRRAVDF